MTSTTTHRADGLYRLQVDAGLERVACCNPGLFNGTELLAMAEADWDAPGALLAAKRLMRQALAVHLGAGRWSAGNCFASADHTYAVALNLQESLS
jgi:hypothetical protein